MKDLDFVVIGAQKCATTTLFELLRQHPEISMPLEKELPFFTGDNCSPSAWSAFASQHFQDDGRLWGKASPQYMANADIPARIAALMPAVKLIAILRDPLERSRSHFRMAVRRDTETGQFATAMERLLEPMALATARAGRAPLHEAGYEAESEYYLVWSEYGRILANYRNHFPAEQLLVLYTEDLEQRPQKVLDKILTFLGADTNFHPRGLGEVMHAGGGSNRIPQEVRVWFREQALVRGLWNRVPASQQGRIRFLYERWNTRKEKSALPLSNALESRLRTHLASDIRLLLQLGAPRPPWADDYLRSDEHYLPHSIPAPVA